MRATPTFTAMALVLGIGFPAWSADFATKDEAVAMVKKAVVLIGQDGPEKAYAAFDTKGGAFTDRELGKRAHRKGSFPAMARRCECIHTGASGKSLSNCRRSFGDKSLCNCFTRSSVTCVLPR